MNNLDKTARSNKFLTAKTAKGVFDERNIEGWSSKGRFIHPYLEMDDPGEEYEEVLDLINDDEEERPEIPNLFRYERRRALIFSCNYLHGEQLSF